VKKLLLAVCLLANMVVVASSRAVALDDSTQAPSVSAQSVIARDQFKESFVVVLHNDFSQLAEIQEEFGFEVQEELESSVNGFIANLTYDQVFALSRDQRIELIEENSFLEVAEVQQLELNDCQRRTWGLDRINQANLPLDLLYSYEYTGLGVDVYVVDSGISAIHEEFGGRVSSGFSIFPDTVGSEDCHGHGTSVAGVIGSETYGVAKEVNLIPVRILNCTGSGSTADVLTGIEWMINDHDGSTPAVANMSIGRSFSAVMNSAVASAVADNISVVIAAGNFNRDACSYSPASEPLAITVGGINQADGKVSSSNFGPCIDLFAPGTDIVSPSMHSATSLRSEALKNRV
jgi:serine protease